MVKKCVVLHSGGMDSTTLLYELVSKYECYPLSITYGQRHEKEVIAARNVCEARDHNLLLRWKLVRLDLLRGLLPSSLTGVGNIPYGHYQEESMKSTVVPNRNMILLALAAGYAQGLGASFVGYAAHAGDHAIYPDCRPEFVEACGNTIRLGTGWDNDGVQLLAPYVNMTKADICERGAKLNVPYHLTWSCYEGRDIHCGVCGTCTERKEAFKLAGVPDPTKYLAEKLDVR